METSEMTLTDDRVLVKVDEAASLRGSLIIPETAKERPQMGTVLAVGPGKRLESGARQPIGVAAGQRVLFGKYSGHTHTKVDDRTLFMRESDVLAIVEDE